MLFTRYFLIFKCHPLRTAAAWWFNPPTEDWEVLWIKRFFRNKIKWKTTLPNWENTQRYTQPSNLKRYCTGKGWYFKSISVDWAGKWNYSQCRIYQCPSTGIKGQFMRRAVSGKFMSVFSIFVFLRILRRFLETLCRGPTEKEVLRMVEDERSI